MDFNDQVDVRTSGFASSSDDFDCVLDEFCLAFVLIGPSDGVKFDGGKAFGNGGFGVFVHGFGVGSTSSEKVKTYFVAAVATQEFPDWDFEMFALDVVKGDVHRASRPRKSGTSKGIHAIDVLPVVFDA